ncbi:MAG TPA: FAD-dependent oxidoreductase, partial [Chitinophagaceae bacterium]|nr:FAD-dependent oxidoreductase [Chitinophagaceae bacterium]
MKNVPLYRFCLLPVVLIFFFNHLHSQETHDVLIYGGTAGGYAAALQVARMGKSVALLEPTNHIGGNVVEGLGSTDIDNHSEFQNSVAVGGIALEFYRRIAKAYGRGAAFNKMLARKEKNAAMWKTESGVAETVIKQWLSEYKIDLFYNTSLAEAKDAVTKNGTSIVEIKTSSGIVFRAKVFIDASMEGDLLAAANITTVIGREANSQYNETLNGIRAETDHAQFKVNVNPFQHPGDPNSGLVYTVQDEPFGEPGAADKHVQAYCFRVCLTQNDSNKIPFYKPPGYNPALYEIYLRYLKAGGKLYEPYANIPNGKTDLGAWHDLSHNLYGMNIGYPGGSYSARKTILDDHKTFTQGLFYFLANDRQVAALDGALQKAWSSWGYARDEFTDNNGFPRMFYVRDARRMVSDYVITEQHVRKKDPIPVDDPVAISFWPADVHSVRRIVKDGFAYNEGFVFGGDYWRPMPLSYRAIIPKREECTNLLTPTCPSASHIAYGAIRIEFTFMALGQACGTAAAMAVENNMAVQDL